MSEATERHKWAIIVGSGVGTFFFEGTEAEAEHHRGRKASWEQAVARKRIISDEEFDTREVAYTDEEKRFFGYE